MKKIYDPLLRKVLETGELVQLRNHSLESMLVSARLRRRRRGLAQAGLGMLLAAALLFGAHRWTRAPHAPVATLAAPPPSPSPAPAEPAKLEKVKLITTEELLALFPDRPLALVGPPGEQRLIFFDEPLPAQ